MSDTLISISETAQRNIRDLLQQNGMEGHGLRFAIRGGGCSGYSYVLEFQESPEEGDEVVQIGGLPVFVGALKRDYLRGTLIDFKDTEWETGFEIRNPNARRQCGCGESFDIDDKPAAAPTESERTLGG